MHVQNGGVYVYLDTPAMEDHARMAYPSNNAVRIINLVILRTVLCGNEIV